MLPQSHAFASFSGAVVNSDASARKEIVALETPYWEAVKAKDGKRAADLSGARSLVTGAQGVSAIAKEKMGAMSEDGTWHLHSYAFDKIEVTTPAPNVAIIAYTVRQSVTMHGKKLELHSADSSTWIKGTNGWECHAHSETFLHTSQALHTS